MTKANVSRSSRAKTGGKAAGQPCACCGIARDPQGRPFAITYDMPDVIIEIEPELLETWGEDPFLVIKNVGFFVRVLLPVQLTDGFGASIGTWLEVHPDDFRKAWQTWNFPEYSDLAIEGYVANTIAPWGQFPHALVRAVVRDVDQVPYLASSDDPQISKILGDTWPHPEVLTAYSELLKPEPPAGS
ncbi:MAG: DUF2199 domain-containing protein [Candidatus Limnocylindrales bacterium]